MIIEKCRSCGGTNITQFMNLGNQPFANALIKPGGEIGERSYPLSLSYCKDCFLVQLDYTADPEELFSNYFWVTGTSSTAMKYAEEFCENAREHQKISEKGYVLEVASNDGTFLKPFRKRGYKVLGVDPAKNIVDIANKEGVETENAFFGSESAKEIVKKKGFPDIIFARNVLPHVADTNDFLEGISNCCRNDTLAIIEIHYSGIIAEELHYDSIYHEHLCYFTLKSIQSLMKMHGLYIYDIMQSPISGGSIVLYLRNRLTDKTKALIDFECEEEKKECNTLRCWEEFAQNTVEHGMQLRKSVEHEKKQGNIIIGYGASARSSTMLNYCGIGNALVDCIIDQNKMKQGMLTPGTHIPIVSPQEGMERKPDTILLLAWNFRDEIIDNLKNKYGFKGKVIVPLPFSVREEIL